jgi:proline iminopeptidase
VASVHANGITIEVETSGNPAGPAVLLIMGLGMQLTAWPQALVDGLAEQGFHVIRFDNRDSGLSSSFSGRRRPSLALAWFKSLLRLPQSPAYTLHDMADDARALLDALGIAQAHVIGVSMGGMIAQLFAARFPGRTLSLASIMSSSGRRGLPGPSGAVRGAMLRPPPNPADRKQVVERAVQLYRMIGSPAFPTPERLLCENVERAVARSLNPAGTARQMVAIAACGDRTPWLRRIRCRAMVIHGAADPLVPLACGEDTARAIPGCTLHVIEGMGHDLPAQLVERLLSLIEVHLDGKMAHQPPPLPVLRAGSRANH